RQQRPERTPGELAVPDLAPSRRPHPAGLTGRIRREVVVQHEVLAVLALERVHDLLVLAGAERGHDEGLGLTAGEQGTAMRPGKHADFGDDRPDRLRVAPVDASTGIEDLSADD